MFVCVRTVKPMTQEGLGLTGRQGIFFNDLSKFMLQKCGSSGPEMKLKPF